MIPDERSALAIVGTVAELIGAADEAETTLAAITDGLRRNPSGVDLSLEDEDRAVLASDVLQDDLPIVTFTPATSTTYWIRPTMVVCNVNPCGYGIAVFVR